MICHGQQDTDLLIVRIAVQSAEMNDTILVEDDTDLLILLIYHAKLQTKQICYAPEVKANSKKNRVWNIRQLQHDLGEYVCDHILFIHAILCCDTVSRVHGLGQGVALKRMKNAIFHQQAQVFNTSRPSIKEGLIIAGDKALVCLHNSDSSDSLDTLRYKRFCDKVATNTSFVEPQTLPPTSSAGKYHSLRVFYQIQEWKGLADDLVPSDWGWYLDGGMYLPIQTDQPAAPSSLLEVIRCCCKTDCTSRHCTCQKHGLTCSPACGECRWTSCANSPRPDLDVDDDHDHHK